MRHQYRALRCECDTVPSGQPSGRDRYQEGEIRVPHPNCPRHRDDDADNGYDYTDGAAEFYDLEWDDDDQEWVDAA